MRSNSLGRTKGLIGGQSLPLCISPTIISDRQSSPMQSVIKFPASFGGIWAKTERADKHIEDVEIAVRDFLATKPYSFGAKGDNRTGKCTFYVTRVADVPLPLIGTVGDALHNLRSALDHLAYQLVIANGEKPRKLTSFPICKTVERYQTTGLRQIEGMRQNAKDAIEAVQPYRGADPADTLWCLHQLDIVDKHRVLVTAGSRFSAHSLTPSQREKIIKRFHSSYPADHLAPNLRGVFTPPNEPARFPLKAGDELITLPTSEVEKDLQFNFQVSFNESGIIEGEPVSEALHRMADFVRAIVTDFAPLLK